MGERIPPTADLSRRSALAMLAALGAGGASRAEVGPLVVPFRRDGRLLWVNGTLEGVGPLDFLLSFSSDSSVISPELAARCHLKKLFDVVLGGVGEGTSSMYRGRVLKLGETLSIKDPLFVTLNQNDPWPDGWITLAFVPGSYGFDFEHSAFVYRSGLPDLSGFEKVEIGRRAEARLRRDEAVRIVASINGHPASLALALDGAYGIGLNSAFTRRLRLWDEAHWSIEGLGQGDFGKPGPRRRYQQTRLASLDIGETRIEGAVATIFHPEDDRGGRPPQDGSIGLEVLRRFSFWVCRGHDIFAVRPNAYLSEPFAYDRSGFATERMAGVWRVTQLMARGPAEKAGLRLGDVVVENAHDELKRDRFAGPPGSKVIVRILRDGIVQDRELVLEELL